MLQPFFVLRTIRQLKKQHWFVVKACTVIWELFFNRTKVSGCKDLPWWFFLLPCFLTGRRVIAGRSTEQSLYQEFQVSSINVYLLDWHGAEDISLPQSISCLLSAVSTDASEEGKKHLPQCVCCKTACIKVGGKFQWEHEGDVVRAGEGFTAPAAALWWPVHG